MTRVLRIPFLLLALASVVGCGSSSSVATGPTPVKCRVSLAGTAGIEAAGGTDTVSVTTQPECTWTAVADAPWISGLSPASGQGNGAIQYQVATNAAPTPRQAAIVVNDDRVQVQQSAAACTYEVSARESSMSAEGGTVTVGVTTLAGCTWTVTPAAPWIRASGAGGISSGNVSLTVEQNTGAERSATVTIAGQGYLVSQAAAAVAPACAFAVSPTAQSVGAGGGGGSFSVTGAAGCAWMATSSEPWIVVTSGAGSGSGTVTFAVSANLASAFRTGTIAVGDERVVVTQAGTVACSYELSAASQSFPESGGAGTAITVTTSGACAWSATSATPWITVTAGSSGTGPGSVRFTVGINTGATRTGLLVIAGRTLTVTQAAATVAPPPPPAPPPPAPPTPVPTCAYSLSSTSQTVAASGGVSVPISVSTSASCAWTAVSQTSWLTLESGLGSSGNGAVTFRAAVNTGGERIGTLLIAGSTFTVTQSAATSAPPCTFGIAPTGHAAPASGGAGPAITVTAGNGCAWTASSNVAWITITAGAAGSGAGTVVFTVAANAGSPRSGTLTVAGQTFTVSQDASCAAALSAASHSFGAAGGAGTPVDVTIAAGCAWTASSSAPWLTITSGASGTGNGRVAFSATANPGAVRSATLTIAGLTFAVSQAAASCTYALGANGGSMAASGGAGTPVAVTTASGCAWTATSNAPWINITSGASGSGPGNVAFTVTANPGTSRTGTLTIAGQVFTVTQAAGCAYSLSSSSQSVGSGGGAGTPVGVTAAAGCTWTATSNAAWLTITAGASGSGNGTVSVTVAANTGAARSGTLTIAGLTFTVSQAALVAPCTYSISPTSRTVGALQRDYTVAVTASAGCAWTASSNVSWVNITGGANGSGNGTVSFRTQRNSSDDSRTGTLTIAGVTFTITQEDDDD